MNNKLLTTLFVSLGLAFGAASAIAAEITVGTPITADSTGCAVLDEDVRPALSKGVSAAYECVAAQNLILVGACHEAGRKKAEEVDCTMIGEWGTGAHWNNKTTADTCTASVSIAATGKAFVGSNAGGSTAPVDLGAACAGSSVNTVVTGFAS